MYFNTVVQSYLNFSVGTYTFTIFGGPINIAHGSVRCLSEEGAYMTTRSSA